MWYERRGYLLALYEQQRDEVGTLARTLDRELGSLWTFIVAEGWNPSTTGRRGSSALRCSGGRSCKGPTTRGGSLGGAAPLGAGDVSLEGPPHVPNLSGRGHVLLQWPASRCLLDLTAWPP